MFPELEWSNCMQVERNSVWEIADVDGLEDGTYRLLEHYADYALLVLFRLHDRKGLLRPIAISHSSFLEGLKRGCVKNTSFPIPCYQMVSEENINEAYRSKRDQRFELIEALVNQHNFLLEFSQSHRNKQVTGHAYRHGIPVQYLYRYLNLYWRYGQDRNALLPAYKYSGGLGKSRNAGDVKRGSPVILSTPSLDAPVGINTTEEDKKKFIKAMRTYGLKGKPVSFSQVYRNMRNELYADEVLRAEAEGRIAEIPKYRVFIYWVKKLIPQYELIKKQTTQGDFDRNRRGLRGAATDHTEVPGSCFEIDSTPLDVHVVSEFNRNHVLGRPTAYGVIDKESRMIVGFHVSMDYASWRAGRQALVNSFTSKKEYCARFGIDIEEQDWPCQHLPQRLLCDRGELVCKDAEKLAVPLIGHLSVAPPYRADFKGIIERRFRILNDKLLHQLKGSTRGRHYIRGDKDPRLEAALTLKEINTLLIDEILEHNNHIFGALAGQSTLLIESDLSPTPLNYWNIHLAKHRHALSKADEAEIRAKILPAEKVTMTSRGIRLNDEMYYECERPEFGDWKVVARSIKSWPLEARIDQDNSSYIFVRLQEKEGFTRCKLMNQSSVFNERNQADVLYFEDWKKLKELTDSANTKSIERHKRKNAITKNANEQLKNTPVLRSKTERIRDMKKRRKEAILDARITSDQLPSCAAIDQPSYLGNMTTARKKKLAALMKRDKEGSQ
ncbi:DDE-type integrase/transposase/recombinase [Aeromonas caviae]|uniref:DDE-type integrase/transposase/recombinase n=1 Tax=Aeromonas caviae TaxID=648 RepID=UPI001929FF5F|nr:DDE-type integrase/transposase/recombinase [Aeromonas caviae]